MPGLIILGIIVVILLIIIISNIHIVPQAHAYVVERLGTYHATWHTGLHVKTPFVDRISKRISLMERVADFEPQAVITKDRYGRLLPDNGLQALCLRRGKSDVGN